MAKQVPLTQGQVAIVDDEDYERVMAAGPWHACHVRHSWYARRYIDKRFLPLANFVLGVPNGRIVDHKDHNSLNNCKDNLREATLTENNHNRRKSRYSTSEYHGVSLSTSGKWWKANITKGGKDYYIGRFMREVDAARAYDKKARELYGDAARLNFPDDVTNAQ
jgi:hypothetical protein